MPLTPTPGAVALAAGFTLVPGTGLASDIEEYINRALDEVAARLQSVWGIPKGGTGASDAPTARSNLGIPTIAAGDASVANGLPRYNGSNQLTTADPTLGGHAASKQYVDSAAASAAATAASGRVAKSGDTMSGHLYLPASSPADAGWTIAYINGPDGRVSRGASSERFKKYIRAIDPLELGDIFPDLHRFKMRNIEGTADGKWIYGNIAERLAEHPDLEPFVVYDGDGLPLSIDFIALEIAQIAHLHARAVETHTALDLALDKIEQLEERLAALETRG